MREIADNFSLLQGFMFDRLSGSWRNNNSLTPAQHCFILVISSKTFRTCSFLELVMICFFLQTKISRKDSWRFSIWSTGTARGMFIMLWYDWLVIFTAYFSLIWLAGYVYCIPLFDMIGSFYLLYTSLWYDWLVIFTPYLSLIWLAGYIYCVYPTFLVN